MSAANDREGPTRRAVVGAALLLPLDLARRVVAEGEGSTVRSEANVMAEVTLTASRAYADPFHEVIFDVTFTDPNGVARRVPTFWAGGNVWKARYSSPVVGRHTYHSEFEDAGDTGLFGVSGVVEVRPYRGKNPLYRHGALRVAESRRYLEHADGTPFFWLGDTWWMGLCDRMRFPEDIERLTADRRAKGFNVVQIVAGLYPDMPPFDPRGANEAGYPWEPDFARIRPEYFEAADRRIFYLVEQGLIPCLVGAWGYFMPLMGVEKATQHWRYLVARYGALPVVWCVAGEANLPYYLAPGFPYDDRRQVTEWTTVARRLRAMDPFRRPMTIHPTGIGRLSARHAIDDVTLLDFDMLQTPHGRNDAVAPTVRTVRESYADTPTLPVIDGEASYERLNDSLPTQWTRRMFWLCLMNGAAGHTYGANGIWQVNRRGHPHGASPHGGNYGSIPWDEAMNLPGSSQVGFGKRLFEAYPWQEFRPHPEWAEFVRRTPLSFETSRWIRYPEGDPTRDAPAEKRWFRLTFTLPEGKTIQAASLRISVDDRFTVWVNGQALGGSDDWRSGRQFDDIGRWLHSGANVLAVEAENLPAPGADPAGLIACLRVSFADGGTDTLVSDNSWHCTKTRPDNGWKRAGFDDTGWSVAAEVARYGDAPWGRIDVPAVDPATDGPQSTGIDGVVRIIYVPEGRAIFVRGLLSTPGTSATYFDPVTGRKSRAPNPEIPADTEQYQGWKCPAPGFAVEADQDWVLILEAKRA